MPDWTYRTVFQPALTRLPFVAARWVALGSMGLLARLPGGPLVIRTFGHAQPTSDMAVQVGNVRLLCPVGLSAAIDPDYQAVAAWPMLGIGLLQVPALVDESSSHSAAAEDQWIQRADQLNSYAHMRQLTPVVLRTVDTNIPNSTAILIDMDAKIAERFVQGESSEKHQRIFEMIKQLCRQRPILLALQGTDDDVASFIDADGTGRMREQLGDSDEARATIAIGYAVNSLHHFEPEAVADFVTGSGWEFIEVCTTTASGFGGSLKLSRSLLNGTATAVRALRAYLGDDMCLIASGGIHQPVDAERLRHAGANVVLVDSGLIESGPGLPKRINQLLRPPAPTAIDKTVLPPLAHQSWLWTVLLGISLLSGGSIALWLGLTRVVLPYDENFLGMLRDEICGLNPRLIPFMQHDRITLAATMLSLGILYLGSGWYGERYGRHWVRVAVLSSATVGFFSFFLFLGYGYFDPFHAFITVVLFQFVLFGFRSELLPETDRSTDRENSAAWQRALWGQLLFVVHGLAITTAGGVICGYGASVVFVPEDLDFMRTTREILVAANANLVPLVAHDRAAFGGMLISTGLFVTFASLWGWRRGDRWLWWSLLLGGITAYFLTVAVHWSVGYTSLKHLLPAYGGFAAVVFASALSRKWLCADGEET